MSDYSLADRFRREAELRARAPFLNLRRPLLAASEVVLLLDAEGRVLGRDGRHGGETLSELAFDDGSDVHRVLHPSCNVSDCEFIANWKHAWETHLMGLPVDWLYLSDRSNVVLKLRLQPVSYACKALFGDKLESYQGCSVLFIQDVSGPVQADCDSASGVHVRNAVFYERRRATDSCPDLIASLDDRLRKVTQHLLDVRDDVRRQLAAELHDSLGQTLGLLRLEIESAATRLSPGDDIQTLDLLAQRVRRAQGELREISKGLHSQIADASGLADSLQALAADFRVATSSIELTVNLDGFRREVPAELSVAIYRIVQESLNNIFRHSNAKNALLSLRSSRKKGVRLRVSDDGVGLPVPAMARAGLGLITMRERAERLGAHYEIGSSEKGGCTICVTWSADIVASLR